MYRLTICICLVFFAPTMAYSQNRIMPRRIAKPVWFEGSHEDWNQALVNPGEMPGWFEKLCGRCTEEDWNEALREPDPKHEPAWFRHIPMTWKDARERASKGIYVEIFADGDIQTVASASEESQSNESMSPQSASTGSLGILLETHRSFYSMSVNVLSDVEPLSNVSNVILNPTAGDEQASAYFSLRRKSVNCFLGRNSCTWGFYVAGSSSTWTNGEEENPAFVYGAGVFGAHDPVNTIISGSHVAIRIQVGAVVRGIGGDVARDSFDEFRNGIVGTKKKFFFGSEIRTSLTFRSVTGNIQFMLLGGGRNVDGITAGQFGGGFNISIPIFDEYSERRR